MQAAGKQERDGAMGEKLRKEIGERRLSLEEWSQLLPAQDDGLLELGVPDEDLFALADRRRSELHPDDVATYIIDRNISYTNICTSVCNFCAFYVSPGQKGGYVLTHEEIFRKVEETLELGGSGILFQGGLHPDLQLDWYTGLFSELKSRYGIHLHCLSPTEILGLEEVSGLSVREILSALKDSGMDSMPGGGGEILVDEVRSKRRSKVNSKEWLDIMETAQELGLPTTATMMFGHGEKLSHRLPDNTPLGRIYPERMEPAEYLRWLALSRIYLDNIDNLQVSWLTQGLEVGKQALGCGANDMGSVMSEENVIKPAGANHEATGDMLRDAITEAGFRPVLRNAAYRRLEDAASLS